MDATLVTVTVLSMSMAATLSAIVWRMLRLERQRSNARVAALANAALGRTPQEPADPGQALRPDNEELQLAPGSGGDTGMFVERPHDSPWGARFAVMAALALVVASAVLFSLAAHARAAGPKAPAASATTHSPAAASTNAELELMSLHDSRQAGSLTITGLVQNPRSGVHLSHVAVTAYTFDDQGSFLASAHALLDVTALAPGDESPFTVTVSVSDKVARYRIGFRDETGHVITHVDRRQSGPVASNW